MPIIRSAKKALRQSKRKQSRNVDYKRQIHDVKKELEKSIKEGKTDKINELMVKFYKVTDKAAKKNVIHKNKAARLKSKITKKSAPKK
jgi:small subunit ribosomal protein S20